MHDLHLANQIVKIAKEFATKHKLSKITKIKMELGRIIEHKENISPKNLKYNINLLLPCQVHIKKIKGHKWRLVSISGD